MGQKLPEAIDQNTQRINKAEKNITELAEDSKKNIVGLQEGYKKLERALEQQQAEDLKSSFLMYQHDLTFEQLKEAYPQPSQYAVVEKFIKQVLRAPMVEFPINKIKVKHSTIPIIHS